MTKTALALLLVLLAYVGYATWDWSTNRAPEPGAGAQDATVLGFTDDRRPGSKKSWLVINFRTDDGQVAYARYERRWFGDQEPGDTITVYQTKHGDWRTTVERSPLAPVRFLGWGALLVLMLFGWFKVRRDAARRASAPPPDDALSRYRRRPLP